MMPLTVHIDFKSPYAYLAIEPTRQLASELGIAIDWQPFVLDIPSYLGSARLDKSGNVATQSRSAEQWSGVKYAYLDCRRYANLRGLTIRGTTKIWDSNLAAVGLLWAKQQNNEVLNQYIDLVYEPFWKRELDLEDVNAIEQTLERAGAEISGFKEYAASTGADDNARLQMQNFNRGIFGVPTYEVARQLYFGREHLPRVRWHLLREEGDAPDIAYRLNETDALEPFSDRLLEVLLDNSFASHLSLAPIFDLIAATDVEVQWFRVAAPPARSLPPAGDTSRSALHRRWRALNREFELECYFSEYLPLADVGQATVDMLLEHGVAASCAAPHAAPHAAPDELASLGRLGGPVFRINGELYVGRQHLPLIQSRLMA